MGWTSTGDPYANVGDAAMSFDSEEAAKSFAERHGWDYVVCVISLFRYLLLQGIFFFIIFILGKLHYPPSRFERMSGTSSHFQK